MNAASYERVSSDEQAKEGFSLEVQAEKNTAYIKSQDWNLYGNYVDPGKSGKNLKRPGMERLLRDIDMGKVQIIVVHKLDRLTRNIGDLHYLLTLFDKKEIKLISITENIDTSTAMGRMFVYMLGIFAQWYRENLSEEVTKGQSKRAEKGLRNTSAKPYGYDVGKDLSLTINEEEADIVRQIYKWYIGGYGRNKIASLLNEQNIPASRGGRWSEKIIGDIIGNPTHIGAVHWKSKGDPEDKRIIVHDRHEPIVSMDVWELAQQIKQRRKDHDMSLSSYDFPFSSIVKCGDCGRSYHGKQKTKVQWGNQTRHYRCSGKYRQDKCEASDISEIKLTGLFMEFIRNFSFESSNEDKPLDGKDIAKERKKLEKLLADSALRRKNYTRGMADGKISYEDFVEYIDEEDENSKKWQAELDELLKHAPASKKTRGDILSMLKNLGDNWGVMSDQERKEYVQRLFHFIVIRKRGAEWKIVAYKLTEK